MAGFATRRVIRGLCWWATGAAGDVGAVHLLARTDRGRWCHPGWPWVQPLPARGWYALDSTALALAGHLSAVLPLAAALLDDGSVDGFDLERLATEHGAPVAAALFLAGRTVPLTLLPVEAVAA